MDEKYVKELNKVVLEFIILTIVCCCIMYYIILQQPHPHETLAERIFFSILFGTTASVYIVILFGGSGGSYDSMGMGI